MGELVPGSREHLQLAQGTAASILLTRPSQPWAGHTALSYAFEGEPWWLRQDRGWVVGGGEQTGWFPPGSPRVVLFL